MHATEASQFRRNVICKINCRKSENHDFIFIKYSEKAFYKLTVLSRTITIRTHARTHASTQTHTGTHTQTHTHTHQFLLLDNHQKANNLIELISLDVSEDVILDEVEQRHAYRLAILLCKTTLVTGTNNSRVQSANTGTML